MSPDAEAHPFSVGVTGEPTSVGVLSVRHRLIDSIVFNLVRKTGMKLIYLQYGSLNMYRKQNGNF